MLEVIQKSQNDCRMINADWDKIRKMVAAWRSPATFAYHAGKDLLINGKNVYSEIEAAKREYDARNYYNFGVEIGKASAQILLGHDTMM